MANMRATIIRNIFSEIDTDHNKKLSLQELHAFLAQKTYANSGGNFDYEIAAHFFQALNLDPENGYITIEQFVKSFEMLESHLKNNIEDSQSEINDLEIEVKKNTDLSLKYAATEVQNIEGLMSDSQLKINILSGSNFYSNNKALSVKLTCEGRSDQTAQSRSPIEPEWDQTFTFSISTIESKLQVELLGDGQAISGFTIPLEMVKDQLEQPDVNMQIFDEHGQEIGLLKYGIHFLWSRKEYHQMLADQSQVRINDVEAEIFAIQESIKQMRSPFELVDEDSGSLGQNSGRGVEIEAKSSNEANPFGTFKADSDKPLLDHLDFSSQQLSPAAHHSAAVAGDESPSKTYEWESRLKKLDDLVINLDQVATDRYGNDVPWDKGMMYSTYAFILLSTLVMFIRPDFPSVCLAGVILLYIGVREDTGSMLKIIALSILGSVLFDMVWLMFNLGSYASNSLGDGAENGLKSIAIFLTFINIVFKICVSFVYWRKAIK